MREKKNRYFFLSECGAVRYEIITKNRIFPRKNAGILKYYHFPSVAVRRRACGAVGKHGGRQRDGRMTAFHQALLPMSTSIRGIMYLYCKGWGESISTACLIKPKFWETRKRPQVSIWGSEKVTKLDA